MLLSIQKRIKRFPRLEIRRFPRIVEFKEVQIQTLKNESRFFLQLFAGNKRYGKVVYKSPGSVTVEWDNSTKKEHVDIETLVVPLMRFPRYENGKVHRFPRYDLKRRHWPRLK